MTMNLSGKMEIGASLTALVGVIKKSKQRLSTLAQGRMAILLLEFGTFIRIAGKRWMEMQTCTYMVLGTLQM